MLAIFTIDLGIAKNSQWESVLQKNHRSLTLFDGNARLWALKDRMALRGAIKIAVANAEVGAILVHLVAERTWVNLKGP